MLVSAFKVTVGEGGIRAPVRAEPVDVERHKPAGEVKGATLTDPRAERLDSDGGGHAWWRYSLRRGRAMELNRPRKSGDCGWIMGPRGLMRIPGILHSGESLWTPGLLDRWPMSPRFRGS